MNNQKTLSQYYTPLRVTVFVLLLWSLLLSLSYYWNQHTSKQQIMQQAYAEARANLNKDITFRRWGTTHGGVYVPVTDTQKSVPWLAHVSGRDVTTTDGQPLTLLNPASMLRQIMDAYAEEYGIRGRITGLKYLNPDNKPDEWERRQLKSFQRGDQKEIWSVSDIQGQPHLRYLRAMFMDPGCDKCHGILGYKEGDFRGATGLNLPLSGYYRLIIESRRNLIVSHGGIWILGLLGICLSGRAAYQHNLERQKRDFEKEEAAKTLRIYANAFERGGEAILITDQENRITNVNAAFTRLTGYHLDENQFELYYQPQLCTSNRNIYAFEALIRWKNPQRGFVGPDKFIPIAEETGLIHAIGDWVLDEACRQLSIWTRELSFNVNMAINLSTKQLQSESLLGRVCQVMDKYAIEADKLEFEVTETAAMTDPELAVKQLQALKELKVGLAIDDFGTGYSSLSYLKRLPIHTLKLDRTFVRDIETDRNDAEISMATIALAHNLGLSVVAEGVETEGQYQFLAEHRCDYLQGYLFSRPLPADEATDYIKNNTEQKRVFKNNGSHSDKIE